MNCERARELIFTDHVDRELGSECQGDLDEHLGRCEACGELERLVREKISTPLNTITREAPPAYLWEGIRERVTSDAEARSGLSLRPAELMRKAFSSILNIPRPVMAFAAVVIIVAGVLIAAPVAERRALDEYLNEQAIFISKLDAGEVNGVNMFDTDIANGVERFM